MKKAFLLAAALGTASLAFGQTGLNRVRLISAVDGYVYIFHYTSTTHGGEIIQGFPNAHLAGFRRIDGIYVACYDKDRSTPEQFDIFIRPDDGKGKPDLTKPPLYTYKASTAKGTGAGWAPPYYFTFPKPFVVPPTLKNIWIGIHFGKDKSSTDYPMFAGLNRHGTGGLAGVMARKGVKNPGYAYHVNWQNGKPTSLVLSDWHWVWYPSLLTKDPILRPYIKLNVDVKPHAGSGSIANKEQYGLGAFWPDINNAEGITPARYDSIGWMVDQHNAKNSKNTLTAFVFLNNHRLNNPIPSPYGPWYLAFGGPYAALGAIWSPLTQGAWKTPAIAIPPAARPILVGTWIYAQAAVAETDSAMNLVDLKLTNMVGMSL